MPNPTQQRQGASRQRSAMDEFQTNANQAFQMRPAGQSSDGLDSAWSTAPTTGTPLQGQSTGSSGGGWMDAKGGAQDDLESRLSPYSQSILHHFDTAAQEPNDAALASRMQAFRPQLVSLLSQYPDISKAPSNVRAGLYAITQLGDKAYGKDGGVVTDPVLASVGPGNWKCNIFVAKTYGLGAGIGYNTGNGNSGYPAYTQRGGLLARYHPPMADDLHNTQQQLPNFPVSSKPKFGDIAAFGGLRNSYGHATIYLGDGLLAYAGANDVKLGTPGYIRQEDGYTSPITYRTYVPSSR